MSILRYFAYSHLPEHLQGISKPVGVLAEEMNARLPDCAEKVAGLRKLLEAKDCFVRASLPAPPVAAPDATEQQIADEAAEVDVPVAEDPRQ